MLRTSFGTVAFVALAALAFACGSTSTPKTDGPGGVDGGATNDGGSTPAPSLCGATREYIVRCAGENELNCGAEKYDAWCAANDKTINSDAYRRAEAKCLATATCEAGARTDCDYKSYGGETPTAAQKALVEAYCATCEPLDKDGCAKRATTYDQGAGPSKVPDIFIAAWELADPIVDQIREQCTGEALPAGVDPCEKRFASCAAGPYLESVPDCP